MSLYFTIYTQDQELELFLFFKLYVLWSKVLDL
jgi:hypothetical protein